MAEYINIVEANKKARMLEEKERLARQMAEKASARAAMEKGVVGSGQVSQKAFDKARASKGISSKLGKAAAVVQGAQMISGEGGGAGGDPLSGAMSGAATGAAFGPVGAVVGGVAGAVMGAASAREARKAHNAQIEAKKHAALGEIEQKKGEQMSSALGQMGQRMGFSLR